MSYPIVQRWLNERMALDVALLEGAGFDGVVAERMAALGCADERGYVGVLDRSREESERLAGSVAVPETWLFRYPKSFEVLVEFLTRRLAQGATRVRMISVGCASGEEPYGMAMAALHAGWPAERVEIEAFDRSAAALARAEAGVYGAFSIRHEVPAWGLMHLQHEGERIVVASRVRKMVTFRCADVLEAGVLGESGSCDVVFCRNVLIYLRAEARARLLSAIGNALREGGLLFVGHAEQMLGVSATMKRVNAAHAFALEKTGIGRTERAVDVVRSVRDVEDAPNAWTTRDARAELVRGAAPTPTSTRTPTVAERIPELDLDDARDLADAGRKSESEALIRSILARKGPSADGLELLGTLRQASDDARGAKQLFEQALYLEPDRPTALLQLALIHEKLGERAQAERMWERVKRATANERGAR